MTQNDEEWRIIKPLIPPPKPRGHPRQREYGFLPSMLSFIFSYFVLNGLAKSEFAFIWEFFVSQITAWLNITSFLGHTSRQRSKGRFLQEAKNFLINVKSQIECILVETLCEGGQQSSKVYSAFFCVQKFGLFANVPEEECSNYKDVDTTETILHVGYNIASQQTVLWMRILDRLAGPLPPKSVAINPRHTFTAVKADVHLTPRVGTSVIINYELL